MYIYIYIYIYICLCVCAYAHTHVCVHVCLCVCVHTKANMMILHPRAEGCNLRLIVSIYLGGNKPNV